MNDNERVLLNFVVEGDIRKAQKQARIVLEGMSAKRDEMFRDRLLKKLDLSGSNLITLPQNVSELLIAEDSEQYNSRKYYLRQRDTNVVESMQRICKAADKLGELGIRYSPSLLLYGVSGCGKTELARYIAYKLNRPFVYARLSNVVSSYLGSTQSNILKIFDYARNTPCVLCFDEIDAIGMARGQRNDVGEMNRVTIALMQELDRVHNNVVIIGTTNRYDRLDEALTRRFTNKHEVTLLSKEECYDVCTTFLNYCGRDSYEAMQKLEEEFGIELCDGCTTSSIISACIDYLIDQISMEVDNV